MQFKRSTHSIAVHRQHHMHGLRENVHNIAHGGSNMLERTRSGIESFHSSKQYDTAKKVVAATGSIAGLALILNAARRSPGFDMMKDTLSDTRFNGISFSMGALACSASTILMARTLRKSDPGCMLNNIGTTGLEASGYSLAVVGLSKWVLKGLHAHSAGFYFIGTPLFLTIVGIDELRHKSVPAGAAALAATGAAALSFIIGFDRKTTKIPAAFETVHATSLSLWALGMGASKFLIPMLRDRNNK